ncbi:MAG TPA: hypothetical protein VJ642_09870 [Chromobacteriaceae bacterium]|nr:hypothetical protein [Chromobacteriaceae bacterium]
MISELVMAPSDIAVGAHRTRSKMALVETVHQALEVLLMAEDARVVHWDGRILRIHKLTSRKANQLLHTPEAFPGLLGVFDHRASYRDLAEPLGDILGLQL